MELGKFKLLLVVLPALLACNSSSNFGGDSAKKAQASKPEKSGDSESKTKVPKRPTQTSKDPNNSDDPKNPEDPSVPAVGDDDPIEEIRVALDNLRWSLPCSGTADLRGLCQGERSVVDTKTLEGEPSTTYTIKLRFRGIVELKPYSGGTNDGAFWQIGGSPSGDLWNVYKLQISDPPQTYYLNRGLSNEFSVSQIDFQKDVEAKGNATFTLSADTRDGVQMSNDAKISIPEIEPGIYNGQFIQINVIDIK